MARGNGLNRSTAMVRLRRASDRNLEGDRREMRRFQSSWPTTQSYAEILREARNKVLLASLGIGSTKVRRSANGAIFIKTSDADGRSKDALAL